MTKEKISAKQLFALLFVSRILSTLTFTPSLNSDAGLSDYILAAFVGGIAEVIFFIPALILSERGKSLQEFAGQISQKLGKTVSLIYALYFLYLMAFTFSRLVFFVSSVMFCNAPVLPIVLITAAAVVYAVSNGIESIGRTGAFGAFVLTVALVIILVSLSSKLDTDNLTPLFYSGTKPFFLLSLTVIMRTSEPVFIYTLIPKTSGNIKREFTVWWIILTLFVTVLTFFLMCSLGELCTVSMFPYHAMAELSEFSVIERMDSLLTGVWILSAFVRISLCAYCFKDCASGVNKQTGTMTVSLIIFAVSAVTAAASNKNLMLYEAFSSLEIRLVLFVVFVVAIPVLLLCVRRKKA